jgi:hypothetical protein
MHRLVGIFTSSIGLAKEVARCIWISIGILKVEYFMFTLRQLIMAQVDQFLDRLLIVKVAEYYMSEHFESLQIASSLFFGDLRSILELLAHHHFLILFHLLPHFEFITVCLHLLWTLSQE